MKKSIKLIVTKMSAVGLDLADEWSDMCGLDESGTVVRRERVRTTEPALREVYSAIKPTRVAIEAGTHSAWVARVLTSLGHEVIVANTRKVALIGKNKKKNNRKDAELLARLARADKNLLHPIQHRDEERQAQLSVLRSRDTLVATRTKLINHARGTCKTFGVKLRKCSAEAFVVKTSASVPAALHDALNSILAVIADLTAKIRDYDKKIDVMYRKSPAAQSVGQIRGVGALTALAFVLTIADPTRITNSRSAGAYFGLVPGSKDSGEKHQPLRITKEGNEFCRRLLIAAGHYILGPFGKDCDLRRHGEKLMADGGKDGRKRAVVAVARKLAVLMHRLWIGNETYQPLFNALAIAA